MIFSFQSTGEEGQQLHASYSSMKYVTSIYYCVLAWFAHGLYNGEAPAKLAMGKLERGPRPLALKRGAKVK
jgi:hypothetical protein